MTIQDTLKHLDELEAKARVEDGSSMDYIRFRTHLMNSYPSLRAEIERLQREVEKLKLDVSAKYIQQKDPGI